MCLPEKRISSKPAVMGQTLLRFWLPLTFPSVSSLFCLISLSDSSQRHLSTLKCSSDSNGHTFLIQENLRNSGAIPLFTFSTSFAMQRNSHRFWELTGGNLWRTVILPPTEHNPTLSIQIGIREGRWQLKRKQLLETKGSRKVSSIIWTTGVRATVEDWKLSVLSSRSTPCQTQTNPSGLNQEGKLRQ